MVSQKVKIPNLPKPPDQLRRRVENTIADLDCLLNSDCVTDDTAYINRLARNPGAAIPRVTTLIDYASRYQVELTVANDTDACRLVNEDMLRGWLRRAGRLLADKYPGTLVAACNALGIRQSYKNWFAGKLCSPRLDVFITVALTLGYRVYWWAPWWSVEARAHAFETALPRRGVTKNMKG